ncbi:hypothetical protein [Rhodoferax sp.]|uniref:hypothetical protein n=1 Tax=Rhodoferax sp. TaxID=50421 RepID=UPI00374DF5DF
MNSFGNLVVTLLAFALGLGSLKIAGQGVFSGTISGLSSSGADVLWAKNPLAFVFLLALWTGLGLLCLLVGWRGIAQPADDAQDEDDESPMPLPVTKPGPAQARAAVIAPKLSQAVAARELEPMPAPVRQPRPLPEPLRLYPSRLWAAGSLVFWTLWTGAMAYVCLALVQILGPVLAKLLFGLWLLLYLVIAWKALRDFFWQGPALELDQYGITDYRYGGRSILWTEVKGVRLHASSSTTSLVVSLRHLADVQAQFGVLRALTAVLNRVFYKGFEGRIKLTSLKFRRAQLLQVAQAFLRNAQR